MNKRMLLLLLAITDSLIYLPKTTCMQVDINTQQADSPRNQIADTCFFSLGAIGTPKVPLAASICYSIPFLYYHYINNNLERKGYYLKRLTTLLIISAATWIITHLPQQPETPELFPYVMNQFS